MIAIILIKYKPIYKVSILGEEIGYISQKEAFEESIKENVKLATTKNIEYVDIKETPKYELKLVDRNTETNEEEIIEKIENNLSITYKYYNIALNNETIESVNTIEEAKELINKIKEENKEELELSIIEQYTQNEEEVKTNEIELAKSTVQEKIAEVKVKKAEEARIAAMPDVNGIKLATTPVTGRITSRYGESSSLRKSTHTGLDIGAAQGTPIKVVADRSEEHTSELQSR